MFHFMKQAGKLKLQSQSSLFLSRIVISTTALVMFLIPWSIKCPSASLSGTKVQQLSPQ